MMRYEFRLFGPRKGQTININGHRFVNGVAILAYSSEAMGSCMKVLGSYGAYARGTEEYNVAMDKEQVDNGTNEVPKASSGRTDESVRGGVQPNGGRPSTQEADSGAGDVDSDRPSASGAASNGDGHEHAGLPTFPEDKDNRAGEPPSQINEAVKAAILKLDPDVDSHWVMTGARKGRPKLNSVEEAYGKTGLDLKDLENAIPGWTRDAARESALAVFGG